MDKKNSTFVLALMGRLNNYAVDNGEIEVYPYESMPYPDTTTIKLEDNDELYQTLDIWK